MTRCGSPEFRAVARIWPSRVRFPKRSDALFRLIRELAPPARMSISQCATFWSAVLPGVDAFKRFFSNPTRDMKACRGKRATVPEHHFNALFAGDNALHWRVVS